jgi:hypothetical protein
MIRSKRYSAPGIMFICYLMALVGVLFKVRLYEFRVEDHHSRLESSQ